MSLLRVVGVAIFLIIFAIGGRSLMNQKNTEPMLGQNGPFGARLSKSQHENETERIEAVPSAEFDNAGSLSIYLMREPSFETFSKGLVGEDRYIELWLDGDEWGAIYFNVLGCPTADSVTRFPNENRESWEQRYSSVFRRAIPEYPMLGRMSDLFLYIAYKPQEIEQFRKECIKVQSDTSNQEATNGLSKLIKACDEALKLNSGLLFVPQ